MRHGTVRVQAPVRVADIGGWTDTWFGAPGRVCHVAVGPGVTVTARRRADRCVRLVAPDVGLRTTWQSPPGEQPLLEAAIGSHRGVDVEVTSAVPPGAALGTSASVVVGVLAALDALEGRDLDPPALAVRAHEVETVRLGWESGVQDQWAAATGGANLLTVDPYPTVSRRSLRPGTEIAGRLLTVVVGAHRSSAVHRRVITSLQGGRGRQELRGLAALAEEAADALEGGDLVAWGRAMTGATHLQGRLHPALVGPAHHAVIDVAARAGALGWKVNGAGGDGGSVTVLVEDADARDRLRRRLMEADASWRIPSLEPVDRLVVERPQQSP